ncbi:MAG: protein kinase, partial [Planctomycetia bacterium]|nr:protein kinase [Planctomycetia bacterium]
VAMLLGTKSLLDRLEECQAEGLPGIPVDELVKYLADAAKGIDFLNLKQHNLGEGPASIQHCDIKPANMMLVGDSVVVCDFGLARMLGDVAATATGMVGSPAYMAPECVNRKPSNSTDQYSLAVSYVELRTGRLPFKDAGYAAVIEAHRTGQLDLSGLNERELEVIRKATRVEPSERFPSCSEMVEALRQAQHELAATALQPKSRRLTSLVIASLTVTLVSVGAVVTYSRINPAPPLPAPHVGPSPTITHVPPPTPTVTLSFVPPNARVEIDGKIATLDDGGHVTIEAAGDASLRIAATIGDEFDLPQHVYTLEQLREQDFKIELQRTGASYARSATETFLAGDVPAAIAEFRRAISRDANLAVPTPISIGKHNAAVRALQFSADGEWLASASDDGTCRIWQIGASPQEESVVLDDHGGEPLECLAIDRGGRWLATGGWDERVVVRELQEDRLTTINTVAKHDGDVLMIAFTPDDRWLVSAGLDARLRLWPLGDKGITANATDLLLGDNENDSVDCEIFTLSQDGRWLLAIDIDRRLHRWDLSAADIAASKKVLAAPSFRVKRCLVRPSTTDLILVGEAGGAATLDFSDDLAAPIMLPSGTDEFESLAIDAAGGTVLAGTANGSIYGWRQEAGQFKLIFRLNKHIEPVVDIAISADGAWALSGGWDKAVFLWRIEDSSSFASPLQMSSHSKQIHAVAIDPAGRWCATASEDGQVLLWDLRLCQLIQRATEGLPPQGTLRTA